MTQPTKAKKSRGFTLPEVIVTITLIAALAAVVVPAISAQLKKGDPSRIASDAQAIRGAVEQFLTDVRRYPASMGQLTTQILRSEKPLTGTVASTYTYVTGDTSRWKGPYITKDSISALSTGYGYSFQTAFGIDTLPASGASSVSTGNKFLVLKVAMPASDQAGATALDQLYDDGNILTGSIRYRTGTVDTLKFILLPIS